MRVLCYNVRHGQGVGGLLSNGRIARVISTSGCDIAALTEVWRGDRYYDQPAILARFTGLEPAFLPVSRVVGFAEGNLVLSSQPASAVRHIDLGRNRGCIVVERTEQGRRVAVAATHLSVNRQARRVQVARLAEALPRDLPLVVAGDFNCEVDELDALAGHLTFPEDVPKSFPAIAPMRRLDHIGFSREWRLESLIALPSWASDHLPLLADLTLGP